ncbi:MAG: LuxE/PaaK family acyltransferase [Candidatus Helarchaeota archaeon]
MANSNFYEKLRAQIKATSEDCKFYHDLCIKEEYNFDQSINDSNLEEIPYVNWAYFKESNRKFIELLRIPYDKLAHWTVSSSTSGDPSLVGRGPEDIRVFQGNYKKVFDEFSKMNSIEKLILFAPDLKFMNKMPGRWEGKRGFLFYRDITKIWENYDITYLLKMRIGKAFLYMISHFKLKAFIEIDGKLLKKTLKQVEKEQTPTLIANSAPLMYKNFTDYLKKNKEGFDMPDTFRVQTGGGGWSGKKGRVKLGFEINKAEFLERVSTFFNIPIDNFADLYGATEVPIACGGHWSKKHGDFILHANKNNSRLIIRSMETLERIKKTNEPGVLEVITPYGVNSYAGVAVLLDDIIEIIDFNKCSECGREGLVFKVIGKLTPEVGKGCISFTNLFPFEKM